MTDLASGMEARMGEDPSQAGLQLCREPGPVKGTPDQSSKNDEKSLS